MRDDRHFERQAREYLAHRARLRRLRIACYALATALFMSAFLAGLFR